MSQPVHPLAQHRREEQRPVSRSQCCRAFSPVRAPARLTKALRVRPPKRGAGEHIPAAGKRTASATLASKSRCRARGKLAWRPSSAPADSVIDRLSSARAPQRKKCSAPPRASVCAGFVSNSEDNLGKAEMLLSGSVFHDDAGYYRTQYSKLKSVTPIDVKARRQHVPRRGPSGAEHSVPLGKTDQASKPERARRVMVSADGGHYSWRTSKMTFSALVLSALDTRPPADRIIDASPRRPQNLRRRSPHSTARSSLQPARRRT